VRVMPSGGHWSNSAVPFPVINNITWTPSKWRCGPPESVVRLGLSRLGSVEETGVDVMLELDQVVRRVANDQRQMLFGKPFEP
jgi:hypothetical protein